MVKKTNDEEDTFGAHFNELRRRLLIWAIVFVIFSFLASYFKEDLLDILMRPLAVAMKQADGTNRLIYTGLAEGFMTVFKVSLFAGFFLSIPVLAYELFAFVRPGLFPHERRALAVFILIAPFLFLIGVLFAYWFVLPMAYLFFLGFQTPETMLPVQLEAKMSEYLSLTTSLLTAFGMAFELPLVLMLLGKAGILTAQSLIKFRRFAIVLIFIVAAVLTPPDVISQLCLALPLLGLYELTILLMRKET